MKKIIVFTRCVKTYYNFRKPLIDHLVLNKFDVTVCMDFTGYKKKNIENENKKINFQHINFLSKKINFLHEFKIFIQIFKILTQYKKKECIIQNFTIKPVLYVSFISIYFSNFKLVNTVTGLGHSFFKESFFMNVIKFFYNFILLKSHFVVFQNNQDKNSLIYKFLHKKIKTKIIFPDLKFKNKNIKIKKRKKIVFLMFSRFIKEKGIVEYYNSAKYIKKKINNKYVIFNLIGDIDLNNPSSLTKNIITKWKKEGHLNIYKFTKNIFPKIVDADVVVLPSYGEGLPGSLIEAMFCKKALIASKVNGCVELVKNNVNGLLIKPKNTESLIEAILFFLKNKKKIKIFGQRSRLMFDKMFKISGKEQYLNLYNSL